MSDLQPVEGSEVVYVGEDEDMAPIGGRARVMANAGSGSHVQWLDGPSKGKIHLVAHTDIVTPSAFRSVASELDDSLADGTLSTVSAREVYAATGADGLLATLRREGHLSFCANLAVAARESVISSLREDPVLGRVLDDMTMEAAQGVLRQLANMVLRDAARTR
jgi:hypothetical protein